jgi:hypothetical protein
MWKFSIPDVMNKMARPKCHNRFGGHWNLLELHRLAVGSMLCICRCRGNGGNGDDGNALAEC